MNLFRPSAIVACCLFMWPTTSWAATPAGDSVFVPTGLDVDTSQLAPEDTALLHDLFMQQLTKELAERYRVPLDDPANATATLHVVVTWEDFDASHWKIQLTVERDSERTEVPTFVCEVCGSPHEVVDRIFEELPGVVPLLEVKRSNPPPAPSASNPPTTGDPPDDRPRRPLGRGGKAGIGLTVLSVPLIVAGSILAARGTTFDDQATGRERSGTNVRPPGVALAVLGGAALITGVTLIAVDRHKARSRKLSLAPVLGPTGFGATLQARF